MQREDFRQYMERCFAYSAYSYVANINRGDMKYESAVPVYLISFIVEESKDPRIRKSSKLVTRCWFTDEDGQNFENQFINIIFVRLYEVKKDNVPNKDTSSIERCSWLMKHLPEYAQEPDPDIIGEFGAIVSAAKIAGFGKEKKRLYKTAMDKEHLERAIRYQNRLDGIEEGRAEGRAEGKAEGKAEGRKEEKLEIATRLLKLGLDFQTISLGTGLTIEEIQALE